NPQVEHRKLSEVEPVASSHQTSGTVMSD
ncbi:uncharacterized, partial [Tachysurus ichikawai]